MQPPFVPKKFPREIRKHQRFAKKSLHRISMQLEKTGIFCQVANLSIGGIGYFLEHNTQYPEDKNLSVHLNIDNKKFEVAIEVVHRGEKIIGCAFKGPPPQLLNTIDDYFKTELLAQKMSKIETKDENAEGKTIYFIGQSNCEVLIQEIDGLLQRFRIILLGNYIEGDGKNTLYVGEKIDSELNEAQGVQLYKPILIAEQHLIESAMRFIDNIQDLSVDQKKKKYYKILITFYYKEKKCLEARL